MHPITLVFRSQELENDFRKHSQISPVLTGILLFCVVVMAVVALICIAMGQIRALLPMMVAIVGAFVNFAVIDQHPYDFVIFRYYNNVWHFLGAVSIAMSMYAFKVSESSLSDTTYTTCLRLCMHACAMATLPIYISYYTRHAHIAEKALRTVAVPACHIFYPFHGLGDSEEMILFGSYWLVGHCIGYVVELLDRTIFLKQQLQGAELQQLATVSAIIDECLNHVILGNCGTARGMLRCLEERLDSNKEPLVLSILQRSQELLDEAATSCERRQLSVQLQLGNYSSKQKVVDVRHLLRRMMGADERFTSSVDKITVDEAVLRLALDEALTNARRFRQPGTRILVAVTVEDDPDSDLTLLVSIDNLNADGVPFLTHDACEAILRHGFIKRQLSAFLDGIGLAGVAQAARKAGGDVHLAMYPSGGTARTNFRLSLPCSRSQASASNAAAPVNGEAAMEHASRGRAGDATRVSSGDGSTSSTSETSFHPVPTVMERLHALDSSFELSDGVVNDSRHDGSYRHASERQRRPLATATRPLVCIGLDDQAMCRLLHELIFETFLSADPERSGSIGETRQEIESFCDVAMGKLDLSLSRVPLAQQREADVVIIDQNLVLGSSFSVLGSDIARQLRREGFRGVIGIFTGSADIEVRRLAALEGIDFASAKHESAAVIADRIMDKLQRIAT
uniref:Histidine kinase/HSP90-like ATPase domain-containing protein n=1 Tax=Chrysotila carterae TaxID=13221 RepID=A0A7S4BV75_CHRCT